MGAATPGRALDRCLAVTGTDGKTTTTFMATAMLEAAGFRALAVGNTEVPLVAALDSDAEAFVVECTSFRLQLDRVFRPDFGVWLNLAPDHLNWHRDLESYTQAKARPVAVPDSQRMQPSASSMTRS